MMLFSRTKSRNIDTRELSSKVDQILEGYRPELLSKIEEFQAMQNLGCMKHIRTWVLVSEIERGKILKKLLKLWVFGIFGYLLKHFQRDLFMDKLEDKDLERIYKDTRQNYTKSILKQINRSLASEFAQAGYPFRSVQLEETLESQWSKRRRPRTVQGKFWWFTSKLFSASKLPSLLAVLLSGISASMYYLMTWLTGIIQSALKFTLLVSILVHFLSGVANAVSIFYQWLEDIAEQIEELCQKEELDREALADQWLAALKEQAHSQIETPIERSWLKVALVSGIILLVVGFTSYTYWPGSVPVNKGIIGVNTLPGEGDPEAPNTEAPIIEILDKAELLNRMQKWGKITVLTQSGSNLILERTIPKKIFGGTIPTTDLQIKVTYDYSTDFILDLRELTEADLEIEKYQVRVYLRKPKMNTIKITNDRQDMTGAVFANNGTPEQELEDFEPGDQSYMDILRRNVEAVLLKDQALQSKVELEAKKNLKARLLDAEELIDEVEVILVEENQ